jgi:hypothetical protein
MKYPRAMSKTGIRRTGVNKLGKSKPPDTVQPLKCFCLNHFSKYYSEYPMDRIR